MCRVCRVCSSHRPVLDWSLCTPPPPARTSHHAAGSRLGHTATPAFKSARALAHIDSSWEHSMYVLSNEEMIKTKEPLKMFAPCAVLSRVSGPGISDRRMTGEGQCTWTCPRPAQVISCRHWTVDTLNPPQGGGRGAGEGVPTIDKSNKPRPRWPGTTTHPASCHPPHLTLGNNLHIL